MTALCSRTDFLGRLGRHYLTDPDGGGRAECSPRTLQALEWKHRPRLSLRSLASYRTLLLLLLLYVCGAFLSFRPVSITLLILSAGFLYGVLMVLFGDKLKRH